MWNWLGNTLKSKLKLVSDQSPDLANFPEDVRQFSYKTLKRATNNFSNILRSNGVSTSYKGTLADGLVIVVKVFERNLLVDFISMTKIMSGIKHRNMVELIGCCIEDDHRMLVHDFVGDFSLDRLLFADSDVEHAKLDWPSRVFICHGVARGLEYLVNGASPGVVNLDVKPSNILLDRSFNPKIVDFDVSGLIRDEEDGTVRGTMGYLDPEYMITGRFTGKTDVYAFGIVLLELISGKKYVSFILREGVSLVDWVWELRERNRVLEFVDPTLSEYSEDQVIRFVDVALFCVQVSPELRPSMSEVKLMLSDGYNFRNKVLNKPRPSVLTSTNDYPNSPASEAFSDNDVDISRTEEPK